MGTTRNKNIYDYDYYYYIKYSKIAAATTVKLYTHTNVLVYPREIYFWTSVL